MQQFGSIGSDAYPLPLPLRYRFAAARITLRPHPALHPAPGVCRYPIGPGPATVDLKVRKHPGRLGLMRSRQAHC